MEVVFDGAGAAAISKPLVPEPYPTLSIMFASVGFTTALTLVELLHKTILPAVALILKVPVASGVGNGEPVAPPANWIRKYPLAGIVPENISF